MPLLAQRLSFSSPLNGLAWALLAAVPACIVLLYFLKLRRRPVHVPSTLLWKRSIEDLHVNSLFQRLRKNLLLFLQLLMVGLVMLALARPMLKGLTEEKQRFVIAIDESASMGATDTPPTRLDEAKRQAQKIVAAMGQNDVAMIIAFSGSARVVSPYTSDKGLLRSKIAQIRPTDSTTALREALQLVAGLANPQKSVDPAEGQTVADVVPPKLFLITDGGFADVEGFSLGTITPEVIPIGPAPPPMGAPGGESAPRSENALNIIPSDNVAILALQSARTEDDPEVVQVFGRVRNHRAEAVSTQASLYRLDPARPGADGKLVDAIALELAPMSDQAIQFDLKLDAGSNEFEVRIDPEDALALDNRAFVVIGTARRARVLLVTAGNRFLSDTFRTESAAQLCELSEIKPEALETQETANELAVGRYDLVIFDRCAPARAPESNTIYFENLPPGLDAAASRPVKNPVVLDWDLGHPLMQYLRDLGSMRIDQAATIEPPTGARTLMECDQGPLMLAIPREGYLDVAVGFSLMRDREFNTDWPLKTSFPLFIYNSLRVLGRARTATEDASTVPGEPVVLRPETPAERIEIIGPDGRVGETLERGSQGAFVANQTQRTGIYHARWDPKSDPFPFAVNLFDARESDLSTRGQVPSGVSGDAAESFKIKIGHSPVDAKKFDAPAEIDWWWPLTLAALAVLVIEWIVYNKRVFV